MTALWDRFYAPIPTHECEALERDRLENERHRVRAKKQKTGAITIQQMRQLRALCLRLRPRTVIEIGTFIGNSTRSFVADHVYTCDKDNDLLPSSKGLTVFPRTTSTAMLSHLVTQGIVADLFFFDGRIQEADLGLILRLSHPGTVYVFDDYAGKEKGVANARRLATVLPSCWTLITPDIRLPASDSTLAMYVPDALLSAEACA